MPDYLELHNLQPTVYPYTVERVVDPVEQASPECVLPDDLIIDLGLPSLDITMPDLECENEVEGPLIPPVHIEVPEVVVPCPNGPSFSATVTNTCSEGLGAFKIFIDTSIDTPEAGEEAAYINLTGTSFSITPSANSNSCAIDFTLEWCVAGVGAGMKWEEIKFCDPETGNPISKYVLTRTAGPTP